MVKVCVAVHLFQLAMALKRARADGWTAFLRARLRVLARVSEIPAARKARMVYRDTSPARHAMRRWDRYVPQRPFPWC